MPRPETQNMNLDEVVASNVHRLRQEKRWSITTLAEELNRPKHVVYDMERPRKGLSQRAFLWSEIVALCDALDTNLFELVLPPKGVRVVGPNSGPLMHHMGNHMEAQFAAVFPEYVEGGVDENGHVQKIRGSFQVELILSKGSGLTFEKAHDYVKNQTKFKLTPVE